jgi:hypothetical protein
MLLIDAACVRDFTPKSKKMRKIEESLLKSARGLALWMSNRSVCCRYHGSLLQSPTWHIISSRMRCTKAAKTLNLQPYTVWKPAAERRCNRCARRLECHNHNVVKRKHLI